MESKEWQNEEREAEEDSKAGRVKTFDKVEDLLESLHADSDKLNKGE